MSSMQPIRTRELAAKIKSVLGAVNERNRMIFVVGTHTGFRISDMLLLRVRDIQSKHIDIQEKKTGKNVRRLISHTLRKELDQYTKNLAGHEYLFQSRFGTNQPLTRAGAYKVLRKAAEAVGLRHIGCHTLRKTFAYHMYKKEKNVAKLQELLNHSSPRVTMRYIGIIQDELDESMQDFDL